MIETPETKLAYIAALVDTLGKITVRSAHRDDIPVVTIQGKYEVLSWLAVVCGVKLIQLDKSYSRHQCSEHCPDRHMDIESWTYRFQVSGARAYQLLHSIEPYMRIQPHHARQVMHATEHTAYKPAVLADAKLRLEVTA